MAPRPSSIAASLVVVAVLAALLACSHADPPARRGKLTVPKNWLVSGLTYRALKNPSKGNAVQVFTWVLKPWPCHSYTLIYIPILSCSADMPVCTMAFMMHACMHACSESIVCYAGSTAGNVWLGMVCSAGSSTTLGCAFVMQCTQCYAGSRSTALLLFTTFQPSTTQI